MRFSFFEDNNGKYANLTKRAFREVHLYNLLNKNYWLWIWGDRQIMTAFHTEIPLKGFMKIMFEKWIAEEKHFMSLILLFKPVYIHPPQIELLSTAIQPPLLGRQFSKCGSAECFLGDCPCHNHAFEQTGPFQVLSWSATELSCRLYLSGWVPSELFQNRSD